MSQFQTIIFCCFYSRLSHCVILLPQVSNNDGLSKQVPTGKEICTPSKRAKHVSQRFFQLSRVTRIQTDRVFLLPSGRHLQQVSLWLWLEVLPHQTPWPPFSFQGFFKRRSLIWNTVGMKHWAQEEPFTLERTAKALKESIFSTLSYQLMHSFSSYSLGTFEDKSMCSARDLQIL